MPISADDGTTPPMSTKRTVVLCLMCSILVALYVNQSMAPRSQDNPDGYKPATAAGARGACQTFLSRLAHDPDSMQWVDSASWQAHAVDDHAGQWVVRGYARGRTPIGGMRLAPVGCTLTYDGVGSVWRLVRASAEP